MTEITCHWTANCLPEDRPEPNGEQTLCVHELCGDNFTVEISDIVTEPESWGAYLADVGRAISGALAERHGISKEQAMAEMLKGIRHTFLR